MLKNDDMTISSTDDLESEILREHSKRQTIALARWVGHDKNRFKKLMTLFLRGEYRVTQRSAWIVNECAEGSPELINPWLNPMVAKMQEPGVHGAVPRNVLRIFASIEIPKSLQGEVVTICFAYLMNPSSPIAVQVHAMSILVNISREEPDLKNEVRAVIESLLPQGGPAVNARARMVLKALSRTDKRKGR